MLQCGRLTVNAFSTITNHVNHYAGGIYITSTNTTAGSLTNLTLSFDTNPVRLGDFWGLRWSSTNGYAKLVSYTNSGAITIVNNLAAPYNTTPINVYTNNGDTYIGFKVTHLSVSGTAVIFR